MNTVAIIVIIALLVIIAFLAGQVIRREPRELNHPEERFSRRLEAEQRARQWSMERQQTVEERFVERGGRKIPAWADDSESEPEKPAIATVTALKPEQPKPVAEPDKAPAQEGLFKRMLPHLKPLLYAMGGALLWGAMVVYYDNLSRYIVPSEDTLGDFKILFLKKSVGAALPVLSGVAVAVLAFFMLIPKIYTYINGWTAKDFDLISDLKDPDRPGAKVRLLFFAFFFALFYLSYLKFFPLSIQDLTL